MQEEVRRIGRARFEAAYWPSLEYAMLNSVKDTNGPHSLVICDPNKDNALAGFVLVCPPPDRHKAVQWGLSRIDCNNMFEIAFVAIDSAWEGKGLARQMLSSILSNCPAGVRCWLHVDIVNPRAARLYESLGFSVFDTITDPHGSVGYLMISERKAKHGRNADVEKWTTLFNACPREAEQTLSRGIFAPPCMPGGGHALPCLV